MREDGVLASFATPERSAKACAFLVQTTKRRERSVLVLWNPSRVFLLPHRDFIRSILQGEKAARGPVQVQTTSDSAKERRDRPGRYGLDR